MSKILRKNKEKKKNKRQKPAKILQKNNNKFKR